MILALALACSPTLVEGVTLQPGTGTPNAPTNTVVVAVYRGTSPVLASPGLALEDATHTPVVATTMELPSPGPDRHLFALIPDQPLAPGARYYIDDTVNWDCTAEPCTTPMQIRYQFDTASVTDTTAPPTPPAPEVAGTSDDVCDDGSCCATYHARLTALANPATGAIGYDLYDDGTLVESNAPLSISTDCAQPGDEAYLSADAVPLAPGTHHLTWVAFDNAGNRSAASPALALTLDCDGIVAAGPDGGPPGDNPGDLACGCRTGGGTTVAPLAFVTLLLALRRRR